jgi:ABC-type antimicrobial peptide transport system permease subunit
VLQVKGVYKDIPKNSNFTGIELFLPMKVAFPPGAPMDNWYSSSFNVYAQLAPNSNRGQIVSKIKNIQYEHTKDASQPSIILNPMSKWHLYEFDNGALTSGRLRFVWLFGIIAVFVLILACINFMNLSKARSEKRAREIGVRKAIGSGRSQLVKQFLTESLLIVLLAFCIAIGITYLSLSWFNELSGKDLAIDWSEPFFWIVSMAFIIITSLLAGSFPALFLSSFNPVKALKGTFTTGRYSSIPRKVLVVVQFTVSIVMIMGTLIVYNQVKFARDRPVGYDREKLITIQLTTDEIKDHYAAFRNDLLAAGAVKNVALSSSPATGIWSSADNLDWKGKDPSRQSAFGTILVEPEFGNTVGWKMKEGRNFSAAFSTDSFAFIFNEAAIRQMGLEQPIGETIKWHGKNWKLIGVVNDMVMTSPFDPARPVVFMMNDKERSFNVINVKLNPAIPVKSALSGIETVFKKYATTAPFDYKFVDTEYGLKFTSEERTGQLAAVFAGLAIFISCLGLFGLASFVAEKRTKEIGVRKILGASVFNLWGMLSKDFVLLIVISSCIAVPVSYYYMDKWLHNYQYRTTISWWVFAVTIGGALAIALLTVSFQALKAAVANPVKSLRTE